VSANWTVRYPDAGDMSAIRAAAAWCEQQILDLEGIDTAASNVLSTVDEIWQGGAATQFSVALLALRARANDSRETLHSAARALAVYADTVNEICREATPLRAALAGAEAAVTGGQLPARSFDAYMAGLPRAMSIMRSANAGLQDLAERRSNADQDLARSLVVVASEAWSTIGDAPRISPEGYERDQANADVRWLLGTWVGGGQRAFVLGQHDAFVRRIQQSDYIGEFRHQVLEDIRNGQLRIGYFDDTGDGFRDPSRAGWHGISNNPLRLLTDIGVTIGAATTPRWMDVPVEFENLPDTFLGSYGIRCYVDEPAPDGSVMVTYVIENATTIDSATRIPVLGGHVPGLYELLNHERDHGGNFEDQEQMIVWTEKVYP
jgi:uncharacterized protein YukE